MSWPVILSGVVCVTMLALGLTCSFRWAAVWRPCVFYSPSRSPWSFSALWMTHSGTVETPVEKSLAAMEMPVRIP